MNIETPTLSQRILAGSLAFIGGTAIAIGATYLVRAAGVRLHPGLFQYTVAGLVILAGSRPQPILSTITRALYWFKSGAHFKATKTWAALLLAIAGVVLLILFWPRTEEEPAPRTPAALNFDELFQAETEAAIQFKASQPQELQKK